MYLSGNPQRLLSQKKYGIIVTMKVLLVDDEQVILTVSKQALSGIARVVDTRTDPKDALDLDLASYDVILSDFYMPGMRGDEFLKEVRARAPHVPFVFLTQNEDLSVAVELMRQGADDYISKPINPTNFVFRVRKVIHEKEQERQINQVLEEQKLLDLENRKLANWRILYASKDARQTEMLVSNLSRNINQAGGFLWLDLLAGSLQEVDQDNYSVPKAVMEMALNSARNQERLFNQVTYIGSLEDLELDMRSMDIAQFHEEVSTIVTREIVPILGSYERTVRWNTKPPETPGPETVTVDLARLTEVLRELAVNAIKYSPAATPLIMDITVQEENKTKMVAVQVSNIARRLEARDDSGNHIHGIPYDYKELVFDLFFTMEGFPEYLPEESWTDGSGLFIARKLMRLMGGWITANSGVDYTPARPQPLVRMEVRLPLEKPS